MTATPMPKTPSPFAANGTFPCRQVVKMLSSHFTQRATHPAMAGCTRGIRTLACAGLATLTAAVPVSAQSDLRPYFARGFVGTTLPMYPGDRWWDVPQGPEPVSMARATGLRVVGSSHYNVKITYANPGLHGEAVLPDRTIDTHILRVEGLNTVILPWPKVTPGLTVAVESAAAGVTDRFGLSSPIRRTALDGAEYEAVPLRVDRSGVGEWVTLYFGYRMGQVAGKTGPAVPSAQAEDYELAALPPPFVEGEVVEYVHRPSIAASPWGHFFYAASEADKALLDGNADWMRTGRSFKSGGYLPVCRFFYRPPSGGAATHFYTARADECERFKTQPGFTYEGIAFRASLPRPQQAGQAADDPARCPEKTVPLWRYFNAPASAAVAPNHRYVLNRNVGQAMATGSTAIRPWAAEGIALCVPE
jgi:hypothetical protein